MRDSVRSFTVRLGVVLLVLSFVAAPLFLVAAPSRAAATTYPPVNGAIVGPRTVGEQMSQNYTLTVSGGPAVAANGTVVGTYAYTANFSAINETGIKLGPAMTGAIVNGSITLEFVAPNVTEVVTISVLFKSIYQTTNATLTVTAQLQIVQPFIIQTTLVVGSGASVQQFYLTVLLDGTPVGQVAVPTLTAGSSRGVSFRYVDLNLSPGWHTFSMSLANQHGLVTFPGGAQAYDQSFYVAPPAPDYTPWYLAGTAAFFGAILIWTMRVGARRRGKGKK